MMFGHSFVTVTGKRSVCNGINIIIMCKESTVAGPGFPVGGGGGGADLRRGYFSAKTYAKTKELDPVGGVRASSAPLDLPMVKYSLVLY